MVPKRKRDGTIIFKDFPSFTPNLTPREIFILGSFGGTYWRPIYSKVTKKNYKNKHKEFPKAWWKSIPNEMLTSDTCNKRLNRYGVVSGSSLSFWESKGWIKAQDPYGWVQWYCRFYKGRRTDDDERQIKRWENFAGPNGRFRKSLINQIKKKKSTYDDESISPKIRQGLQQWAYELSKKDFNKK